jgi:glycosyltransferase involved in cell wall biosynthesis
VRIVSLNAPRTGLALPGLVRFLRAARPDVLIAGLTYNNIVALCAGMICGRSDSVTIVQRNTFSALAKGERKDRLACAALAFLMRTARRIVAVSAGVADDLSASARVGRDRISVIYNPIVTPAFEAMAAAEPNHPWFADSDRPIFVAAGRLTAQKDYPTFLSAVASARRRLDLRALILGDGPLRRDLGAMTRTLGIENCVDFVGFVENPLPYMRRATALVLTSSYEGFGNVLAEALACGVQVISTACNGPVEILDEGRLGRLCRIGDFEGVARAMILSVETPPDRQMLRAAADRFRADVIAGQYLDLARSGG